MKIKQTFQIFQYTNFIPFFMFDLYDKSYLYICIY